MGDSGRQPHSLHSLNLIDNYIVTSGFHRRKKDFISLRGTIDRLVCFQGFWFRVEYHLILLEIFSFQSSNQQLKMAIP